MAPNVSFCHLVASRPPGRARCAPVPRGPWHRPQQPEPEPERASPLARERPGADPAAPDLLSQARGKGRPPPRAAEVRGARRASGGRAGRRRCVPGAFGEPPGGVFPPSPGELFLRARGRARDREKRAPAAEGGGARSLRGKGGDAVRVRPPRGACVRVRGAARGTAGRSGGLRDDVTTVRAGRNPGVTHSPASP